MPKQFAEGKIMVYGENPDAPSVLQIRKSITAGALRVALMADHHKGYGVPIGGVVAHEDSISLHGVGYDIACGNKAVKLDVDADEIKSNISTIMADIRKTISFGVGRQNQFRDEPVLMDNPVFSDSAWKLESLRSIKEMARGQLGTVGSGNHFVDVLEDEDGFIWIGVHFGSRGMGYRATEYFMNQLGASRDMNADPMFIKVSSALGADYLATLQCAGMYAYAGRNWVCDKVAQLLGHPDEQPFLDVVHANHNFAWRETLTTSKINGDPQVWVTRKGATPFRPNDRVFVGSTMATPSYILTSKRGYMNLDFADTMHSTIHGAGRKMGRMEAAGKYKKGKLVRPGVVSMQDWQNACEKAGVCVSGGWIDEAPQCYKEINDVLAAHSQTVMVEHTLTPIGVAMASPKEFDPYKE